MELTGQLHNPSSLLQSLLSLPVPTRSKKAARVRKKPRAPKRRLGDVRDTMIAVLREEGGFLRVSQIHRRVEQGLDGQVIYAYVRDFLNHRSRGEKQLFERRGYGWYRLHSIDETQLWPQSPLPTGDAKQ